MVEDPFAPKRPDGTVPKDTREWVEAVRFEIKTAHRLAHDPILKRIEAIEHVLDAMDLLDQRVAFLRSEYGAGCTPSQQSKAAMGEMTRAVFHVSRYAELISDHQARILSMLGVIRKQTIRGLRLSEDDVPASAAGPADAATSSEIDKIMRDAGVSPAEDGAAV